MIAKSDDVEINVIEGTFLSLLFQKYVGLEGRFYHYLACILINRISKREKALAKLQTIVAPTKNKMQSSVDRYYGQDDSD